MRIPPRVETQEREEREGRMKKFTANLFRIAIIAAVAGISAFCARCCYVSFFTEHSFSFRLSLIFTIVFFCGPLAYFALLSVLRYCFYREAAPPGDAQLPFCTVIVPAYNEGAHVAKTIESLLESDYPADKFEIIAVDDGSIDDTRRWIRQAAETAPKQVKVIFFNGNRGKRAALDAGFAAARGRILVTVDSDSLVEKSTLRRIVAPLVEDPEIGAVSGSVLVGNADAGVLPAFFETCFTFSFDFIRCAQSVLHGVVCTPGAISAYRRTVVDKVREAWVAQTFMGHKSGIGEDRALTNMILEQGYGVVMQRSARISTNVPETYSALAKTLLRWERGNVRENLRMYLFIFKDFRWNDLRRWFLLLTLLIYTETMLLPAVMIWASFYYLIVTHGGLLLGILAMALLWATLPALVNLQHRSTRVLCRCYLYGIFYALTLFWLLPYAVLTVNDSRWMTRRHANSAGKC